MRAIAAEIARRALRRSVPLTEASCSQVQLCFQSTCEGTEHTDLQFSTVWQTVRPKRGA